MSTDIQLPAAATPLRVTQTTAVEQARAVAEVAAAVQVAQMNPRDIRRAWAEMQESCGRLGLAQRAFYSVTNRGTGPALSRIRVCCPPSCPSQTTITTPPTSWAAMRRILQG